MVPKCKLFENVPLHIRELNYEKKVCELEDHVGEEALNLNLPPKLSLAKITFFTSFPIRLLENIWIEYVFPYGLLPHHKGAK